MNTSEEDYLKAIYELESKLNSYVSITSLSSNLNHTVQSTNEMIKKLSSKGYVTYIPYKGCLLTDAGRQSAISLIRKHRIWEFFLSEKLGYTWEEIHEEAEILEHLSSLKLIERLYEFLDKPVFCPHGNPIPDLYGNIETLKLIPLLDCEAKSIYSLRQVVDKKDILLYLSNHELALHDSFEVIQNDKLSEIITLKVKNKTIHLGYNVAGLLLVEKKMED